MSKTIAIVTGTRAEYGLLSGISRELRQLGTKVQLIVTGAHLSPAHGMTVNDIEEPIAARVDMQLSGDDALSIANATGLATSGLAQAFAALKPDIALILGDRYEMLAAATAALLLRIPVAHIHGGEVTEGAMDESIRHAITKLSTYHFASCEAHARRLRQLGEDPAHIFTLGAPGIDHLAAIAMTREQLQADLGIKLNSPVALFTYHPETLSALSIDAQIAAILAALKARPDMTWLITGANADAGGRAINTALEHFASTHTNAIFRLSLGQKRYASALKEADIVVGNSSSALIEAPVLGTPAVDIGDRQKGRTRAPNIVDCPCDTPAILDAITRALRQPRQPSALFGIPGKVAPAIAHALLALPLLAPVQKRFVDL